MIFPAVVFLLWDEFFTRSGVWSFSNAYTVGIRIGNLPIEEALFFITVPYCCMFIYECVRCYFPKLTNLRWADKLLWVLALILFFVGILQADKAYTAYTFILNALFIGFIYIFKKTFQGSDAASFIISFLIKIGRAHV